MQILQEPDLLPLVHASQYRKERDAAGRVRVHTSASDQVEFSKGLMVLEPLATSS